MCYFQFDGFRQEQNIPQSSRILLRMTLFEWMSHCKCIGWNRKGTLQKKVIMLKLILGVLVCAIMCACVHMTRHPCPEIILLKLSLSVWKRVCSESQVHRRWTNLRFCLQWDWETSNYSSFRIELKIFCSHEDLPMHFKLSWVRLSFPYWTS